ncbi:MAG TPA: VapC toxin family PIN domain ribonuclease [Thermoanaerobaculia bacterium]|nr:VapC toxin family PIN domain ribonuclease [Thermoanaerobaculia bacterium]
MRILVDSTVWIDYFNGAVTRQTDFLDRALGWRFLGVGDLIFAEVLGGYLDERERELAEGALGRFRRLTLGGFDLGRVAARNSRILRAKGLPAPNTLEGLIATFAIEKDWALLHSSPGYEPFEQHLGLKVPDLGSTIIR